jgi:antitoxin component of RelBE/YafQ-DinJ toxin-antitoxin module
MKKPMIGIRIEESEKNAIEKLASEKGMDLSGYLRQLIKEKLKEEQSPFMISEQIMLKALSELLFMTRAISDKIDPSVKDHAKEYGVKILEKLSHELGS